MNRKKLQRRTQLAEKIKQRNRYAVMAEHSNGARHVVDCAGTRDKARQLRKLHRDKERYQTNRYDLYVLDRGTVPHKVVR